MYVFEICAESIFVTFPWWLKNVKSRSKTALFSNERHFEIWFPKKRTITFFWNKLSKLHKKDPILHVATTFSLKQEETRTRPGPIPHPLSKRIQSTLTLMSIPPPPIVRDHTNVHKIRSHIPVVADRYPRIIPSSDFDIAATGRKKNVILYLKTPVRSIIIIIVYFCRY